MDNRKHTLLKFWIRIVYVQVSFTRSFGRWYKPVRINSLAGCLAVQGVQKIHKNGYWITFARLQTGMQKTRTRMDLILNSTWILYSQRPTQARKQERNKKTCLTTQIRNNPAREEEQCSLKAFMDYVCCNRYNISVLQFMAYILCK